MHICKPPQIKVFRAVTKVDSSLQRVLKYIKSIKDKVPVAIQQLFPFFFSLHVNHVLSNILDRTHDGHQGLTKCRDRASFQCDASLGYNYDLRTTVVLRLKALFARFGCTDEVVSVNGRQFKCRVSGLCKETVATKRRATG